MATYKHTPGPWSIDGTFFITAKHPDRRKNKTVVAEIDRHSWYHRGEAQANTRLVSKSPEMFDLLTNILEHGLLVDSEYGRFIESEIKKLQEEFV